MCERFSYYTLTMREQQRAKTDSLNLHKLYIAPMREYYAEFTELTPTRVCIKE